MRAAGAIVISREAVRAAERAARRSPSKEVGGILLGFRADTNIHIEDVIQVRDRRATFSRYTLRATERDAALAGILNLVPPGSPIGYVGTWHSHLADVGPSVTDRITFRREVWHAGDAIALIVIARSTGSWRLYGIYGRPRLGTCRTTVTVV